MEGDSYEEDSVPYSSFPAALRSDHGAAGWGREEGFLDAGHDAGDDQAKTRQWRKHAGDGRHDGNDEDDGTVRCDDGIGEGAGRRQGNSKAVTMPGRGVKAPGPDSSRLDVMGCGTMMNGMGMMVWGVFSFLLGLLLIFLFV